MSILQPNQQKEKKNLKHVEVKTYEPPTLKKKEENLNSVSSNNDNSPKLLVKLKKVGETVTTKTNINEKQNNIIQKPEINRNSLPLKKLPINPPIKEEKPKNQINKNNPIETKSNETKPPVNKIEQTIKAINQKISTENKKPINVNINNINSNSNQKPPISNDVKKQPISTGSSFAEKLAAIQARVKEGNKNTSGKG